MSQAGDILYYLFVSLGLGASLVIWFSYLLMLWSRPRTPRWNGKGLVR